MSTRTITFRAPTQLEVVLSWEWIGRSALLSLLLPFLGIPMTLALVAHELGHVIAARRGGLRVHRVELRGLHGLVVFDEPSDPKCSLRVALAGPLTELALVLALAGTAEALRLILGLSGTLDTLLFLTARFSATLLVLHALANLVPAIAFSGPHALGSDGRTALLAWRALRGTSSRPKAGTFQLSSRIPAKRWAAEIARAAGHRARIGVTFSRGAIAVSTVRLYDGWFSGACCHIAVRAPSVAWPSDVEPTTLAVRPSSRVSALLPWCVGTVCATGLAALTWSWALPLRLLIGALGFALVAIALEKAQLGVSTVRSQPRVDELVRACEDARRVVAERT